MELVQDIYVAYAFVHLEAKLNWCHMNRANTKTKTFIILICNSRILVNVQKNRYIFFLQLEPMAFVNHSMKVRLHNAACSFGIHVVKNWSMNT